MRVMSDTCVAAAAQVILVHGDAVDEELERPALLPLAVDAPDPLPDELLLAVAVPLDELPISAAVLPGEAVELSPLLPQVLEAPEPVELLLDAVGVEPESCILKRNAPP